MFAEHSADLGCREQCFIASFRVWGRLAVDDIAVLAPLVVSVLGFGSAASGL